MAKCCSTGVTSLSVWMSSGDNTEAILGASSLKRLSCRSFHLIHQERQEVGRENFGELQIVILLQLQCVTRNSQSFILSSRVLYHEKWCTRLQYKVGGYHEYKDVWSAPIDVTELSYEREPGNARDTSTIVRVLNTKNRPSRINLPISLTY